MLERCSLRLALLSAGVCLLSFTPARAQQDGGFTATDGGGGGVLESIYVPNLPNAPFTLTLHTEWCNLFLMAARSR